jgi:thiol-disulfide isomerase/thioredoxin
MRELSGHFDARRRRWAFGIGLAATSGLATWMAMGSRSGIGSDRDSVVHGQVLPSFPDLSVYRVDGGRELLPVDAGLVRVVNFWARWCGPCRRELPALQRLASRLDAAHTVVRMTLQTVALEDDVFALREYLRDVRLPELPVWRMSPGDAPQGLALTSLPQTFVIGPDAGILAHMVGAREWDSDEQVARLHALARGAAKEG